MDSNFKNILKNYKEGKISEKDVEKLLKLSYIEDIADGTTGLITNLDTNRKYRTGVPEVIYAEGKDIEDTINFLVKMYLKNNYAFATRLKNEDLKSENINNLKKMIEDKILINTTESKELETCNIVINKRARYIYLMNKDYAKEMQKTEKIGKVGILAGGTSDIPIAEEAKITLELMNCEVIQMYDVGVAGIHRLLNPLKQMIIEEVDCIIAIAGMEGALPSVVSSLVDVPVIAVPTSVGYGIKYTALLTMLHSCSPGIAVVNIDNGFGAGSFAGLICSNSFKKRNKE
ncbi:nickel pincer cofactor biosynthesis protein LarB [Methanococcus voltae]|uniref:1-(5-phosphoribosyl)-5-amino-4-imidazole-carboxylate (AIR) carboxylase n=1 Tax=Methanococcus voltae (strain ATCC BAA-1334 / A3) TaxID=456320 RepID=D7DTR7_METV3|nr:nickel pincer cofactor biosynthesis protein LarB [Methanococcus voltae]MCS3901381.1 NCAIR mutase (PurE)-related protein [Methanococcus voltae]